MQRKGKKECHRITGRNAFKLDMHPVKAKQNKNDQAAKIQHLDKALETAEIGIAKLGTQWFELLMDIMKTYLPNIHAINSATAALFHVVEHAQGVHTKECTVQAVKSKMVKRPMTKAAWQVQWGKASKLMDTKATALFNTINLHIGRGVKNMQPSTMLEKDMNQYLPQSKLNPVTAGALAFLQWWTYWDGIKVPKPLVNVELMMDKDMCIHLTLAHLEAALDGMGIDTYQFNPCIHATDLSLPRIKDIDEADGQSGQDMDGDEEEGQQDDDDDEEQTEDNDPPLHPAIIHQARVKASHPIILSCQSKQLMFWKTKAKASVTPTKQWLDASNEDINIQGAEDTINEPVCPKPHPKPIACKTCNPG
ncbi:uncharacterized protein BJ212DRAFT_1304849 [Suillus subaureus]|uniref:Uncharacterized protein n=1 Tax=Suillus subaureus TaxID=48587 RepID=A0A9P7DT15_9AGAM|nr:uncharacterized protein BJ212DRAFT_1304849 [Suillus subaureus]KAG1802379.1 hypothetical protein BJ212DRAFT_1304849 [Suillus subaureus]